MRRGLGWSAAIAAAAVWLSSGASLAGNDEDSTVILFSGRDLWRNGAFAYGGFITAPGGFDDDGLMLKVLMSGGVYRYNADDLAGERVIGAEGTVQILPGFRIKRHGVEAKIFFGPDIERHKLWPDDPGNRLQGTDIGIRFAAEFWTEPTPKTMLAASMSLTSIATGNAARLAYGWRVGEDMFEDGFFVGPEVQYFGADGYKHLRLGLHITDLKAENYEWSAAIGLARDSDGVAGPYVRVGFSVRQ
jgi:hypothetical protein